MRTSDINDNLVTFNTTQHIRLKIKQETKALSYFQEGFFFFFSLTPEGAAVSDQVLVVTARLCG
jgi:hypothetical protein